MESNSIPSSAAVPPSETRFADLCIPATDTPPAVATRPRRRWGRFSLRTLLIAVTLISIGMAFFTNRYERQRRAVAALESQGGHIVFVEPQVPPGPLEAWLRVQLPRSYFDEVEEVNGAWFREPPLAQISSLTSLQSLELSGTKISNEGLAYLSDLRCLKRLGLDLTQVSDAGLTHLSGLKSLQELYLLGTGVSDAGITHLSGLKLLKTIDLRHTQVSDVGVGELQRSLPDCKIYY